MGCTPTTPIIYNKIDEKCNEKNKGNSTESIINSNTQNYKQIEEHFSKKTFIAEMLKNFQVYSKRECLGFRRPLTETTFETFYTYFTYAQIKNFCFSFSQNLIKNKFCLPLKFPEEPLTYCFLGLFAKNCIEWIVADIACQLNSITSATFYATLGDVAFEYISNQTELSTICISDENVETFLKYINKYNITRIKNVILFDFTIFFKAENRKKLENAGFFVLSFSQMVNSETSGIKFTQPAAYEKKNKQGVILITEGEIQDFNLSKPETIVTLCYTSGTTGVPKGVKLSQSNLIAQMELLKDAGVSYNASDTSLIYLPMAHVMERVEIFAILISGAKGGLLSGDVKKSLSEDIEIFKPTILLAVPRVLQLFRQKILDNIEKMPENEKCKRNLVNGAIRKKREAYDNNRKINSFFYDKLVFSKIRAKFGGRIRAIISGSAPLAPDLARDIKIFFCVPIIEGYGLTEVSGAATCTSYKDLSNYSAGGPIKTCKIKLEDVPEMKYNSKTQLDGESSPTGEICIKGPILFKGYFRNLTATKDAIDEDGWFHTGDIGRLLPFGRGLKIIDRKKEIFKLSQGEYIAPAKLEGAYGKSKFVTSIFVYGDSFKTYLISVIVPNKENVFEFLKAQGAIDSNYKAFGEISEKSYADFLKNETIIKAVKADLDGIAKENNFNSLEKINKFVLTDKEFLISNGCLTPTLKLVRNVIAKMFEKEIEEIYQ